MITKVYFYTSALTNNLQKFDEVITFQTCNNIWKLQKNALNQRTINCSHIWHVDIPKCVYWLDTQKKVNNVWKYQKKMQPKS